MMRVVPLAEVPDLAGLILEGGVTRPHCGRCSCWLRPEDSLARAHPRVRLQISPVRVTLPSPSSL